MFREEVSVETLCSVELWAWKQFYVVDLLLIVSPVVGVLIIVRFVVSYFMSILVLQSSWWGGESWSLCLVCLPRVSWCCVALPRGAKSLPAVCDTSWSYSHAIYNLGARLLLRQCPYIRPRPRVDRWAYIYKVLFCGYALYHYNVVLPTCQMPPSAIWRVLLGS